jgi:hypothetical protein
MDFTSTPAEREPAPQKAKWDVLLAVRLGDGLLAWTRRLMSATRFETCDAAIERAGHYALIAAAALGLLAGIVAAIKSNQFFPFLAGIVWVPCVGIVQYVAARFAGATRGLIRAAPTQLASEALLNCLALLHTLLGVAALISYSVAAIRTETVGLFGVGVAYFVACELITWICLNPSLLAITIQPAAGAGEEAIGVLTFIMKLLTRLTPMVFGIGAMLGALRLLILLVQTFRDRAELPMAAVPAVGLVIVSGCLPLIAYVLFVLNWLALDVIRAILSLPGKLDALKPK